MIKIYDNKQKEILSGIQKVVSVVSQTLGPRGQNVIIHRKGLNPIATKDGVTVASHISLEDPIENVGAQIIKQACRQTEKMSGDGTTTSCVLVCAILEQAQKYIASGFASIEIKRGIEKTTEAIVEYLKDKSIPIRNKKDIINIATIAANGDQEIGNMIATAIEKVGKDGAILVEEGGSHKTELHIIDGFRFDSGFISPVFITDERNLMVKYNDPMIFVCDQKIEFVEMIYPVLEFAAREKRPLLIVAEDVYGQALAALIANAKRGTMFVTAVRAPRYGEERRNIMRDLCISTGAAFVSAEEGLNPKGIKLAHFGSAKSVEIVKGFTTIVGGKGDEQKIDERIETLKKEIEQTEDLKECERIQERITRLASGVGIIRVGGNTEVEMIEKKHRIDDALEAVRSAQQEGILPGGGVSLIRASKRSKVKYLSESERFGGQVLKEAVYKPLKLMLQNAGVSPEVIINKIERSRGFYIGYNISDEKMTDMISAGILDPMKVVRCSLQNAVSVATTLIMTKSAVI